MKKNFQVLLGDKYWTYLFFDVKKLEKSMNNI